jgi:RNA polymerase-binding transcription factor DksA
MAKNKPKGSEQRVVGEPEKPLNETEQRIFRKYLGLQTFLRHSLGLRELPVVEGYATVENVAEQELVDTALGDRERAAETLGRVETVIDRFRERVHRVCDGCGGTIPLPRLENVPTNLCVRCQGQTEKGNGTVRRPENGWPEPEDILASGADDADATAEDDGEEA